MAATVGSGACRLGFRRSMIRATNGGHVKASKFLVSLVAGATALGLAACGGPAQTAPSAGATATAIKSGWDINETPRDQLVGGEFVGSISHDIVD